MSPDLATFTSVHAAALCWWSATALALWHGKAAVRARDRGFNTLWCTGCLLLWMHVIAATLLVHEGQWSAAWEHTAQETEAAVGVRTGVGVWFNLLTLIVWSVDCVRRVSLRRTPDRPATLAERLGDGYLAFMWFQAAVVFPHGAIRFIAGAATLVLIVICLVRRV